MSATGFLLLHILPLYALIALGFMAGRWLRVDARSIAALVIYFVGPMVFFYSVSRTPPTLGMLALPVVVYAMSSVICLAAYRIGRWRWKDATPNLLGLSAGTANSGYFGIPIAMMVFDEKTVGLYVATMLGMTLFESSLGYYMLARGRHTAREALIKVLRLPALYAFLGGVAMGLLHASVPQFMQPFFGWMQGAYVVLGVMIIGVALSTMARLELDAAFTLVSLAIKFIVWPALAVGVITLDRTVGPLLSDEMHTCLMLLSIVPLAANSVVFATLVGVHPDKMATTVLISTLLALVTMPLMIGWFL